MRERTEVSGQMIPGLKRLSIIEGQVRGQLEIRQVPTPRLPEPVDARISTIPSLGRRGGFVRY